MILLDTNVLIYATDRRSPQNAVCRTVLDAVIRGTVPGVLVTQVLIEFLGAATGPSVQAPLPIGEALSQAATFRAQIRTFDAPSGTWDHMLSIVASTERAGRRTFDAYLAAQAIALGIPTICTYNAVDFSGVPGLSVASAEDIMRTYHL